MKFLLFSRTVAFRKLVTGKLPLFSKRCCDTNLSLVFTGETGSPGSLGEIGDEGESI